MDSNPDGPRLGKRLDTWKEIGAFFGRDERTVKRWETTRGLPVHRVPGAGRANVYAYTAELEDWLKSAQSKAAVDDSGPAEAVDDEPVASPDDSRTPAAISSPALDAAPARRSPIRTSLLLALAVLVAAAGLYLTTHYWRLARTNPGNATVARHPDQKAEDLYLKGIYYWHKRTPESLNQAVDYFTQAIVRDPNYAEAYVGLANCYNLLREYSSMPPEQAYPRAKAAAERAIALDDSLSAAHSSLAFVDFYWTWNIPNALSEFRRAIELDPASVPAHHWYATALICMTKNTQAFAEIDRAQKLDPQSVSILADRAFLLNAAGQQDASIAGLKEIEKSDPAFLSPHRYLADIYLSRGDGRDFLAESKTAAALMHDDSATARLAAAEKAFATGGERALLKQLLKSQKELYDNGQGSPYQIARLYAYLDQKNEALQYLQAAYAQHDAQLLGVRVESGFASLHDNPAFQKIINDMGLNG